MEEQIQETEVVKEGLASIMPEGGNAMTSIQNATNPGLPVGNIIQQQETARGASEAQLIEYAKSPQPQIIPPYLVTAELLRRKASRERLATAPNLTVAQDAVNNAEQGLMNQMQQQQASNMPAGGYAPPREEITREQIMEEGIAPLPNPGNAVGQGGMAQGGIVGFIKGGPTIKDIVGEEIYFPGQGKNKIGVEDINIEEEVIEEPFKPHYDMGREGELYIPMLDPNESFAKYKEQRTKDELEAGISQDYYKDLAEDYKEDRAKYDEKRKNAGNYSMIDAGIAMMGSKDPNFLSAAATGAKVGMTGYTDRLKDLEKDDRLLTKQDRLLRAGERAEKMGDLDKKESLDKEWRDNNMEIIKANASTRNAWLSANKQSGTNLRVKANEMAAKYMDGVYPNPTTQFKNSDVFNAEFERVVQSHLKYLEGDDGAFTELKSEYVDWPSLRLPNGGELMTNKSKKTSDSIISTNLFN